MKLTDAELDELLRLAKEATPGPWFWNGYSVIYSSNKERSDQADLTENGKYQPGEFFYEIATVEISKGDTSTKEGGANAAYLEKLSPDCIIRLIECIKELRNDLSESEKERQYLQEILYP